MSKPDQKQVLWTPHPRQALFLASPAYECLFGGAAGGGKSDAILMGALRYIHRPKYAALILRRSFPELKELTDRAHEYYPYLGGKWNADEKRYKFQSGAYVEFGYLERYEDVMRYQGRQFGYIGIDELGQIPEERYWTKIMAWNRSVDPEIVNMMRATANPGGPGHAWIRKRFISVCRPDGQIYTDPRTGFTRAFVASKVTDNPTLLTGDPQYVKKLELLPPTLRAQLLHGDWSAGLSAGLEELREHKHIVDPFEIPLHWNYFGAFDWGYRHPFSFGVYAVNEDGDVFKVETITGRRMLPHEIAQQVRHLSPVPVERLSYIVAGHDVFGKYTSRGENTPTIAEVFLEHGMLLERANTDRIAGLNNFREYVAWQGRGPNGRDEVPRFRLFDTLNNRACFEQLEGMVTDEKNPEDVAKKDADPDTGEGGDDMYDETRYALASRPVRASDSMKPMQSAWDPAVLAYERDRKMRGAVEPLVESERFGHPEFGDIL